MLKLISIKGPTLDTFGQFPILFGDVETIAAEVLERLITGTATGGTPTIPITNTSGFAIGQIITIRDTLNSESRIITAVTPNVSLTVGVNLTNTYTVARGGMVTVTAYGAPRASVAIDNPFTASTTFATQVLGGRAVRVFGTLSGPFTQGELCTQAVSGATARLVGQGATYIDLLPVSGIMDTTHTWTGGTSAATCSALTAVDPAGAYVLVTVEKVTTAGAGPNAWGAAGTADVAGMNFTVMADGQ